MYDISCIGHLSSDKIVTPGAVVYMTGGTAYYFSHAIRNLDLRYQLVTAVGEGEKRYVEDLRKLGITVKALPGTHTVCFENTYSDNQDHRTQKVSRKADPFLTADLEDIRAGIIHLGPLLADDFSTGLIIELAGRARLSLDVQGFLREVVDEEVRPVDWKDKVSALANIHYLKANEDEARVLTGHADLYESARVLASWGVKEVILTLGSRGSLVFHEGMFCKIPAFRPDKVVDATGCGDTYMAGYLAQRSKGVPVQQAGEFAAAMATLKIQSSGPFTGSNAAIGAVLHAGAVN